MLSKIAAKKKLGMKEDFRWRGHGEVTRIESLADAVFGLAVTLLVFSQEVPHTFQEFKLALFGLIPFAACFIQLMLVWYQHYKFYRRYNLQDPVTTLLSMTLLFLVLVYVYPLKFLFGAWLNPWQYQLSTMREAAALFTIYGIGYIAVFLLFSLMHRRALQLKDELELNELEIWDTQHSMREGAIYCIVGIGSILLANFGGELGIQFAGPSYAVIGLLAWGHGSWSEKRRKAIQERMLLQTS